MCLSVNNCCCCFTLSVGTKIVAVVSTLSAVLTVVLYGPSALFSALPQSRLLFYAAMAFAGGAQCVMGCLLIYGAFKHKPGFTIPWIVLTASQSAALVTLAVAGVLLLSYNRDQQTTAQISAAISFYFVYSLVLFYFASVVNSRRQQMLIEDRTAAAGAKRMTRHRVLPSYYV